MAIKCPKIHMRYFKCIIITVFVFFILQIFIGVLYFPSNEDTVFKVLSFTNRIIPNSARKLYNGLEDDEDVVVDGHWTSNKHKSSGLRLEELDFDPPCEITGREAISAIHRAKTQNCKRRIVNTTCSIISDNFYPKELPNYCPKNVYKYGKKLGCYQDQKKSRLLSSFYGNYINTNSPIACMDMCLQAGLPYAGVQYSSECFCGDKAPFKSAKIEESNCNMKCPADETQHCGGYFTIDVYETGLAKFEPQIPKTHTGHDTEEVRIVFLLTLNGRAVRQVHRLINALYRRTHYFYIHIDARQDYLHRELSYLEERFPNIKLANKRFSTIWGGASLLEMLLASMKDLFALGWEWDFVINLSESDFPIKSLENLEKFLSVNRGLNFVKSHGREVQRFVKKQGLDKTFVECENHMWRLGSRKLPRGIVIDGGSDWVALSPQFVSYLIEKHDQLLQGLDIIFKHTLLPAESFFHTVLRNSKYCNTYVDNNLHVTNWKRKLGCKCQYKHVVDWCGCSPNDFQDEDWPRIQTTKDKQLFFARKFEPIISQSIISKVEEFIGFRDTNRLPNIDAYWQSIYNTNDLTASTDDTLLTHANSIARIHMKQLLKYDCSIEPGEIIEISTYKRDDIFVGNLILYKVVFRNTVNILMETLYKPVNHYKTETNNLSENIKFIKVSSDFDQKENTFRNFGNILGPFSEPVLLYELQPLTETKVKSLQLMWLDPSGAVADINDILVEANNLTNFIKPNIRVPLLPGVWKVGMLYDNQVLAQTKFLITPLQYFSGKEVTPQEINIIHSGSQSAYKEFISAQIPNFIPSHDEILLLHKVSLSNAKRIQQDLLEWIDILTEPFYEVINSCVSFNGVDSHSLCKKEFEVCSLTKWSSLAPDPKGSIGFLNESTGRLDRY